MIIVGGEALIDLVPQPQQRTWRALPGGSPCNTAIALARLEHETRFLARLSRDVFGDDIRTQLTAADVDLDAVVLADEPSTLAVVSMADDGAASYSFYVVATSDFSWAPVDQPTLPAACHAVHVGSLAAVLEPAATVYHRLVDSAAPATVRSFDPNVRPALSIPREEYLDRVERWVATSDLVRTSDEDLAWLYPDDPPPVAARRWLAAGPAVVVVSRGADGVTGLTPALEVHVAASEVSVADTVGAGDSFTAGLLAALAERGLLDRGALAGLAEAELTECLGFASAVAAVTCTRPGADPPWRHELVPQPAPSGMWAEQR